jgi:hypothetical protein
MNNQLMQLDSGMKIYNSKMRSDEAKHIGLIMVDASRMRRMFDMNSTR